MSEALDAFTQLDRDELTRRIEQLDKIEQTLDEAIAAQNTADEAFRDYMLREKPAGYAHATQDEATAAAAKVDEAWDSFVWGLPLAARKEFRLAEDFNGFRALHDELCIAHKDLNRALSSKQAAA